MAKLSEFKGNFLDSLSWFYKYFKQHYISVLEDDYDEMESMVKPNDRFEYK